MSHCSNKPIYNLHRAASDGANWMIVKSFDAMTDGGGPLSLLSELVRNRSSLTNDVDAQLDGLVYMNLATGSNWSPMPTAPPSITLTWMASLESDKKNRH